MRKLTILILVFLCLATTVFAEMEIDTVKVYVDNERDTSADEEGGTITLRAGEQLEVQVEINNNMDNTSQAKLVGVIQDIDDGSNIEKTQDWYDISANDDLSKTLTFNIPSNSDEDNYDFELKVYYKYNNGTEGHWNIDYEIELLKKKIDAEELLTHSLNNLTWTCNNVISNMNGCYGYINRSDSCSDELSTVKEERGNFKNQAENCETAKGNLNLEIDSLKNDIKDLENQKSILENEKAIMITSAQCINITNTKVKEAEKEQQNFFGLIVIVVGAIYFIQVKKKKEITVTDQYYNDKKW